MIEPKPDLTNIKIEYIWVDVETVARLKKNTKRAVRMSLNNEIARICKTPILTFLFKFLAIYIFNSCY